MPKIYFDHSATTPADKAVARAMAPYFSRIYGNPSSIHSFGQAALKAVDQARTGIARHFQADADGVVFTSGATEANNLAIKGLFRALRSAGYNYRDLHAVTSAVEHDAVMEPFAELERSGVSVSRLPAGKNGRLKAASLLGVIRPNTVLVSVMWANSEVGAIMPIRQLAKMVRKERLRRERDWKKRRPAERATRPCPIYFHSDATQAVNFADCGLEDNYVDLLSFSGHKIYGPKGVGALITRPGIAVEALQTGGHQEHNRRSGTLNVPGIVGLGAAVGLLEPKAREAGNTRIAGLRDRLVSGLMAGIPDLVLNTDRENSTPAHAHFSFLGVEGEALLIALDLEGIAVSTGSACASGSLKASRVLLAMGISPETAHCSVRFSLGKHNRQAEIDAVVKKLPAIVGRLRSMNPVYGGGKG